MKSMLVQVLRPQPLRTLACLGLLLLAACRPGSADHPIASPDPMPAASNAVSSSPGHMSLTALVPSPVPSQIMPPMPAPLAGKFVFYDDFEHDISKWHTSGGAHGVGWYRYMTKSCGGLYTMVLGLAKNGTFSKIVADAYLTTSKPVDLTLSKRPQLQYDIKGITYPFEVITLRPEARKPGGEWQPIGAVGHAQYLAVVTFTADLSPFAGGKVDLRFHGTVHGAEKANKGIYLDDVHVVEPNN